MKNIKNPYILVLSVLAGLVLALAGCGGGSGGGGGGGAMPELSYETVNGVKIELYQGRSVQTLAHEVRHAWQIANGWSYEKDTPYELRNAEIDARDWASKNWSRCTSRTMPTQTRQSASSICRPYTVVAGDSWYGIARKLGKGSSWISKHKQQSLHPNQQVCV